MELAQNINEILDDKKGLIRGLSINLSSSAKID